MTLIDWRELVVQGRTFVREGLASGTGISLPAATGGKPRGPGARVLVSSAVVATGSGPGGSFPTSSPPSAVSPPPAASASAAVSNPNVTPPVVDRGLSMLARGILAVVVAALVFFAFAKSWLAAVLGFVAAFLLSGFMI